MPGVPIFATAVRRLMGADESGGAEDAAMAALSTMVGALILSRVVNDPDLSKRFLDTAAASLTRDRG